MSPIQESCFSESLVLPVILTPFSYRGVVVNKDCDKSHAAGKYAGGQERVLVNIPLL